MAGTDEIRQQGVANSRIELNGIEVIDESERTGRPRSLFWPWFAANISVLGVSYGAFTLGFVGTLLGSARDVRRQEERLTVVPTAG